MNYELLSEKIRKIREEKNMSRKAFERYTGIPAHTQRNYENGNFPKVILEALETYRNIGNVSYDFLLDKKIESVEDMQLCSKISRLAPEQKKALSIFLDTIDPK